MPEQMEEFLLDMPVASAPAPICTRTECAFTTGGIILWLGGIAGVAYYIATRWR